LRLQEIYSSCTSCGGESSDNTFLRVLAKIFIHLATSLSHHCHVDVATINIYNNKKDFINPDCSCNIAEMTEISFILTV
jgi:hypothetical protein